MAAAAGALVRAGARPLLPALQGSVHDQGNGASSRAAVSFGCSSRHGGSVGGRSVSSFSSRSTSSASRTAAASSSVAGRRTSKALRAIAEKAVDTVEPGAPDATSPAQKNEYHFLIANAKFMLDDEEHFQELMRERLRHFGELKREQDFWLVIEPAFLSKFPDIERRLGRPAVALVSTDSTWITFMKLRLDRVLKGAFEADSVAEALSGGNSSTELTFSKPEQWTAPYPKYEGGHVRKVAHARNAWWPPEEWEWQGII